MSTHDIRTNRLFLMGWAIVALGAACASRGAQAAPLACGTAAPAPYPAAVAAPTVQTWTGASPESGGPPRPDCTGLRSREFVLLVAVSGRFAHAGSADALLARVGAVSATKGMTYWSQTDQRREVLITDAAAIDGPETLKRRADFSPAELRTGQPLYFVQHDNRATNDVPYQLRLRAASATGWSVTYENAGPIKAYLLTLFGPGDVQSVITLEQLEPGQWGYRSLTGIRQVGIGSVDRYRASYVNRAVAMFEHLGKP
ncbi:DUF6675 family protein [Aquabacterium sp.]|uniref:DUF6675 family protein n=1 Tax=Aquabacterium sp. TaxID=1872578 RepID=UPI0035B05482